MAFSNATYRGFEIITSKGNGDWTVITETGSGWVCDSLEECKATIDEWLN
jgi:hypothetical protein